VAVGSQTYEILTSVDGLNWQAIEYGISRFGDDAGLGFGKGVAYGKDSTNNPLWVAVGNGTHEILTSVDGLNWQANAYGTSLFPGTGNGIAYGTTDGVSPLWVAVGNGTHEILTSVDGLNWQANAYGTSLFGIVGSQASDIAYGKDSTNNPLWVAVGVGTHDILTSVDGLNWQANAIGISLFEGGDGGFSVAYGKDSNNSPLWVAVGDGDNKILTSIDGLNWQANTSGISTNAANGVAADHLLYGMDPDYYQ
jgi:hypothetical protein